MLVAQPAITRLIEMTIFFFRGRYIGRFQGEAKKLYGWRGKRCNLYFIADLILLKILKILDIAR